MNKNKSFKDLSNMCKDVLDCGTSSLSESDLLDVVEAAKCVFDYLYEFTNDCYEDFNDFSVEGAIQQNGNDALETFINICDDLSCYI